MPFPMGKKIWKLIMHRKIIFWYEGDANRIFFRCPPNRQTTFYLTRLHMTLKITLTSSHNTVCLFKVKTKSIHWLYKHKYWFCLEHNNYPWILLCYLSNKKKLAHVLLTIIFVTFTWFYKIENIVMQQIKIDFVFIILLQISVQPSWKYYFSLRHG